MGSYRTTSVHLRQKYYRLTTASGLPGAPLSIPGSSGAEVQYSAGQLTLSVGGNSSIISVPRDAKVRPLPANLVLIYNFASEHTCEHDAERSLCPDSSVMLRVWEHTAVLRARGWPRRCASCATARTDTLPTRPFCPQVIACSIGQTHAVLVLSPGGVATSELLFNSGTSCYGANVVQVRVHRVLLCLVNR